VVGGSSVQFSIKLAGLTIHNITSKVQGAIVSGLATAFQISTSQVNVAFTSGRRELAVAGGLVVRVTLTNLGSFVVDLVKDIVSTASATTSTLKNIFEAAGLTPSAIDVFGLIVTKNEGEGSSNLLTKNSTSTPRRPLIAGLAYDASVMVTVVVSFAVGTIFIGTAVFLYKRKKAKVFIEEKYNPGSPKPVSPNPELVNPRPALKSDTEKQFPELDQKRNVTSHKIHELDQQKNTTSQQMHENA